MEFTATLFGAVLRLLGVVEILYRDNSLPNLTSHGLNSGPRQKAEYLLQLQYHKNLTVLNRP